METNPKIYKLIKKFITREIKGSDVFIHNGSKWLIFEEDKKWVIELTKEGTLWYNYYFFENIFELVDLDVLENQYYITKWVEDNIINGVKEARALEEWVNSEKIVDKTIQNGVKDTILAITPNSFEIDDAIQNGVKETKHNPFEDGLAMEEAIQNGVKRTELGGKDRKIDEIKDIVENGVKETTPGGYLGSVERRGKTVHQFETAKQLYYVEDVIEYGIKKTEGAMLFDESQIDRVISDGIKETHDDVMPHTGRVEGVIKNGVKETWGYEKQPQMRVNNVINDGIKIK